MALERGPSFWIMWAAMEQNYSLLTAQIVELVYIDALTLRMQESCVQVSSTMSSGVNLNSTLEAI